MIWNEVFKYKDGHIFWNIKRRKVKFGSEAGSCKSHGYKVVRVNGRQFLVHRIIWEMHNGAIPEGMEIDHINHVRDDNRIENLRIVSHADNMKNQKMNINNKSGHHGVSLCRSRGKWLAKITANGSHIFLGHFDTIEEAIDARMNAITQLKFHENHGI